MSPQSSSRFAPEASRRSGPWRAPPRQHISIRSGSGLGDSLYLQSIVRHLVEGGASVEACSDYPDVFRPMAGGNVVVAPFRKTRIDRLAHYTARKQAAGSTQFEDCCISAGIIEPVDLRLDWRAVDRRIQAEAVAPGRPVVLLQMPREPFGRSDGFGAELLPDCAAIQAIVDAIRDSVTLILVGRGTSVFDFAGIHRDLTNRTTVAGLIDLAAIASGFLGYCSFMVPLAESFSRPALFVWARRGLVSTVPFIRSITPAKILHRPDTSLAVLDDATPTDIKAAAHAFLDAIRNGGQIPRKDCSDRGVGAVVYP